MTDSVFIKGYRTKAAYFVENTFGTFNVTNTQARKVGGKVKGVNWTVRQNIMQTGNLGDGRNYKQQLFGQYDANASLSFEVVDFSFLRFGVGDLGKWNNSGTSSTQPYLLVESELSGVDGTTTSNGLLSAATTNASTLTNIRVRPFSMLLYDYENAASGSTYNDNVDLLSGCMINDFSISGSINSPIVCNVNMIVKEIQYKRYLDTSALLPDWTSGTTSANDLGNGDYTSTSTTVPGYANPAAMQLISDAAPLMFFGGTVSITNASTDSANSLGQVTSFNYSYNNNLIVYRVLGSRFIELPQLGMKRQTLSCNVIFRLPSNDATLQAGLPSGNNTTYILELIRNYLGYASTTDTTIGGAAFTTSDTLRPALATTVVPTAGATTGSPQTSVPIEKYSITLNMNGQDISAAALGASFGTNRGASINVRYAAIEGFGLPLVLENGLIEIPITFSVRGYPYTRISDGSYSGYTGSGTTLSSYAYTFSWWL